MVTPRDSNPNCLVTDFVVGSPPGGVVPAEDCNCRTVQPFCIIFTALQWILPEAQELQPSATTVPVVQQLCLLRRQLRILRIRNKVQVLVLATTTHSPPGKKLVTMCGPDKKTSSASLSTPRRSAKAVMSPVRKEKGRSKSPTGSNPSKINQENKTLRQEVEEATRNLAMLQESYERDDHGNVTRIQELERRAGISEQQVAHILKRSDEQLQEAAQHNSTWEDTTIRRSSAPSCKDLRRVSRKSPS